MSKDKSIPLRWIKNDVAGAKFAFGFGRQSEEFTYLGVPIEADFILNYENLAPYVTSFLDAVSDIEAMDEQVSSITIKNDIVEVR